MVTLRFLATGDSQQSQSALHLEWGDPHCRAFSEKRVKQDGLFSKSTSNPPQPLLTGQELLMSSWKVGTFRTLWVQPMESMS